MVPANDATANDACFAATGLRLPPARLQDEIYVLRALVGEHASLGSVVDLLAPKHFVDPANGVVYRWIRMLVRRGLSPSELRSCVDDPPSDLRKDLIQFHSPDHLKIVLEQRLPEGCCLDGPVRRSALRILQAYLGRHLLDVAERIRNATGFAIEDGHRGNEDTQAAVVELLATLEGQVEKLRLLRGEGRFYD